MPLRGVYLQLFEDSIFQSLTIIYTSSLGKFYTKLGIGLMTVIALRSLLENCGNRFYDLLGDLFGSLLLANGDL